MSISFTCKNIIIATVTVATVAIVFLVHALAGLSASPVVFAEPPAFVEHHAAAMDYSAPLSPPKFAEADDGSVDESKPEKMTTDFSKEEALVLNLILDGGSPDELVRLFTHPEKTQRVKVALAFAALNIRLNHDEESDFSDKKELFWEYAEKYIPDIQNAFFEALITSAKEGTSTYIPYTLAWWMPGQEQKNVQVLAWAAKHHPDPWVRRFAVFFVVEHGHQEELAASLLKTGIHDPDYRVRKEVLEQRFRIFTEEI
jgi:putative Ca2+/H+ antiporter (TMEM165/GDT1 family)